ncbi:hypothetical protein J1TS3_37760 [Siminovitchia fordii]|uniref:Uncharacterized protein n=1 Tax=Siminovitchia fordii TaxID=254759 RepID=A0ABQ4KA92_9BACI|nr:hypothetical protein J1TS3_37760 [Siminovitchia fordii]
MSLSWVVFLGSLFTTIAYWTFGFGYVKRKVEDIKNDNKN